MIKKITTLLLLFVATITFGQEKVLLRLNYEKGDSYTMDIKTTQVMGMGVMTNNMDMQMTYNITNVSEDSYESAGKYTKIVMNMSQGGMNVSYDSTKKEEELDETGKMMRAQMQPMLAATITLKGDKKGTILEAKAEPNFQGAEKIAEQSSSVTYPEKAVAVGDTWEMKKNQQGMSFEFIYKVNSITSSNVLVDVTGKVTGIGEGDITGSINIDKKSGVLQTSEINVLMKVQGQDLTTKTLVNQVKN